MTLSVRTSIFLCICCVPAVLSAQDNLKTTVTQRDFPTGSSGTAGSWKRQTMLERRLRKYMVVQTDRWADVVRRMDWIARRQRVNGTPIARR